MNTIRRIAPSLSQLHYIGRRLLCLAAVASFSSMKRAASLASSSCGTCKTPRVVQATAPASPKPLPSFYRRPLPADCTAFSSPRGRQVFQSALQTGGLKSFFSLIEQHTTQTEPAYCGLATLVVALNAMAIDPRENWKTPWRWYQEELIKCCCDFDLEQVKKTGITLADFRCLAICQGLLADIHYADDEATTLERFREAIREVCVEDPNPLDNNDSSLPLSSTGQALADVLVVSYDRKSLGQTGSGHFSPIAAYDKVSDSVLILDTARFKYGSHWVAVSQLFKALQPLDKDTGRSRGFAMLRKDTTNVSSDESETAAQLLRVQTSLAASKVKEEFLSFLQAFTTKAPTWGEFRAFWTRNDTDPGYIWYLVDPVIKPVQKDDVDALQNALGGLRLEMQQQLHRSMEMPSIIPMDGEVCRQNRSRTIPLLHTEAIYLVYIACLEQQRGGSTATIFKENELLRSSVAAIHASLFT